jgi:succinate dehydrogenase/fumarate reductase flavoprotein subunit
MMLYENVVETDVLVIGGGLAGCFAAVKAREQGVDVVLVNKGYVSRSGKTPFAAVTAVFNPEWGHKLDAWMNQVYTVGEYINNREWTRMVFEDSYARYQDLVQWGVEFHKVDGEPLRTAHLHGAASEMLRFVPNFPEVLRKRVIGSGVKILDRIMVTDLVKQNGKVIGAVGIPMEEYGLYTFKAKAIVIAAGSGGFKSLGYPISELTSDGEAIAYRAGAEMMGKEFIDTHFTPADHPGYRSSTRPFLDSPKEYSISDQMSRKAFIAGGRKFFNAEGDEVPRRGMTWPLWLELEIEAHAGRAPVTSISTLDPSWTRNVVVGGAAGGMSVHSADGTRATNTKCATTLPGLHVAGDGLGTMWIGANYSGIGFATMFASVTGARAGVAAAEYALQMEKPTLDEEELARLKKVTLTPTERKGGFSPKWVTQVLQNTMLPYFVMRVKHGDRMQAALTVVEFLRDYLVPKLFCSDAHELRSAHETKNMVLNAEMQLRASIFRTESRGSHFREDYPRREDPDWLAWVILKQEQGKMNVWKQPIPKEWWPDLSKPYKERYPVRIPGEQL